MSTNLQSTCLHRHSAARPFIGKRAVRNFARCQATNPKSEAEVSRRALLSCSILGAGMADLLSSHPEPALAATAAKQPSEYEPMDALKDKDYGKSRMKYSDFVQCESGLQYKDLKEGSGDEPSAGDTVVIDWDGYTIGYYGRPFEARNKPKGSSFAGDKDYYRFQLGDRSVIPALEEAVASMKVGGIRRIVIPVEIGYPTDNWRRLGPKPSTFAGDRALDFVLSNKGMIDKTLLMTVELKNVIKK